MCTGNSDLIACLETTTPVGGAENDGRENDGPSKWQGMKLTDMA